MSQSDQVAPKGLKKRVVKGGFWAIAGFGTGQSIRLVSNLIMSRLLAPEAFGLMAIAIAIDFLLSMLSDLGIEGSIMRSKKGDSADFLATARLTQLIRNILIALFLTVIAIALPALAAAGWFSATSVYADDRLPVFLYIVAASMVVAGFSTMRIAVHNREINIFPVIRLELTAQLAGIAATIISALNGIGVYSLAVGMFVAHLTKAIGSFVILDGVPARFQFDKEHFDEIFGYGKWIIVASSFSFLVVRGDQFILGGLLDITPFSLFAMATIWIMAARNLVEMVVRRVTYPVFSEIRRERPTELTQTYKKLRLPVEVGCIGIFTGIILFSDFAINILYTDLYQDVAHYMKLLAISVLFLPYRVLHNIILTAGESKKYSYLTALPGALLFIGTPFIFKTYGTDVAIVFTTMVPIVALPVTIKFARAQIKLNYGREFFMAIFACAASIYILYFVHL